MLIGQTDKQRYEASQKRLQQLYNKRIRTFAWLPVRLADGRIAWLRNIFVEYPVFKVSSRWEMYGKKQYYLEET